MRLGRAYGASCRQWRVAPLAALCGFRSRVAGGSFTAKGSTDMQSRAEVCMSSVGGIRRWVPRTDVLTPGPSLRHRTLIFGRGRACALRLARAARRPGCGVAVNGPRRTDTVSSDPPGELGPIRDQFPKVIAHAVPSPRCHANIQE